MDSKSDQVPNATNSQVPKPSNSSTPPPNLSPAAIVGIAIGVLVACVILCAIAAFSIRKRIRKKQTKPSIIREELATIERPNELPASINPAELLDHHEDRTELAESGIQELFQINRQEQVELPADDQGLS